MAPTTNGHGQGTTLPASHPLLAELTSLRQQLAQYQKSGHQSAIQLQGARLELSLAKEECSVLKETNTTLRSEVEVLRKHPLPPTQPPTSTALAELTLAHRRLSTKLDLTEQSLSSCQLELASCEQEIVRLGKEREGDRATINELRRAEEEKLEELEWERGERRKAEELKKLCDLALDDYRDLVRDLDPKAVPPSSPTSKPLINLPTDLSPDLSLSDGDKVEDEPTKDGTQEQDVRREAQEEPAGSERRTEKEDGESASTSILPFNNTTKAESISNLMVGQRGVNRLFQDFVATLSTKEREIRRLSDRLEELEHTLSTVTEQLAGETDQRIAAESARETIMRDDASAAKVVERYMTFTQKTHATVHLHLDNLRSRSAATQGTLRKEIAHLQRQLRSEQERSGRMRGALDESSENLSREVAGRRREVGLRLRMIAQEEKRERAVERWLDRVRRTREGVEGAVVEADILEGLLDEGIEACEAGGSSGSGAAAQTGGTAGAGAKDKRSWRGILGAGRRKSISMPNGGDHGEESSIARVLLAEELVDTLVKDLQVETERRMELEKQRVEWLAQEAVEGRDAAVVDNDDNDHSGGVMFDLLDHEREHDHDVKQEQADKQADEPVPVPAVQSPPLETPPPLTPTPAIESLQTIFQPLRTRYEPLQTSLHSLSHSLADLRASLPGPAPSSAIPTPSMRNKDPLADPVLTSILDDLHETLEDCRVDVEIAIADEDRVYSGFEALLGVGESKGVLKEAREFVEHKTASDAEGSVAVKRGGGAGFIKLQTKVADLESDLSTIKSKMHELQGMDLTLLSPSPSPSPAPDSPNDMGPASGQGFTFRQKAPSVWDTLSTELRTVSPSSALTPSTPTGEDGRRKLGTGMLQVGRSFSASVISAPRKVGGFAGGLYRPKRKGKGEDEKLLDTADVE